MGLFHKISKAFKKITKGISKVVSKITPWNDNTVVGKILDVGLGLATGMFVAPKIADMLGLGTTATNAATSTGALAEEAAWDLGQGATSMGTIASSTASKGLFGWASSAWDWAKAHPQLAGSLFSGGMRAIGGYMQAKQMEKWKNKELELQEKALDLKYSYSPIDLDRIKKIL